VVNAETGQEVERFPAGEIWSTPLLAEDALYAGTMEGRVWKLAPDTLDDLWQGPFEVSAGLLAGPSGIGNSVEVVVAGGIGRTLYGIDAVSGEEAWSVEGDNWFWGQPTSDEARVYATNLSGHVIAVDLASGEEAWSFDTGAPIRAGAVITDDGLIAVNQEGDVYGLDSESGEVLWGPTSLDEVVHADPIVVQDEVLVVSRSGDVFLIDPETGVPTEVVR
jgi:outer membrane protein assembly factor BamB